MINTEKSQTLGAHLSRVIQKQTFHAEWHESIGSTNDRLKAYFSKDHPKPLAFILAQSQTAGRGRMGRDFHSPASGLYLSLGFEAHPEDPISLVTPLAAVACLKAIEDLTGKSIGIKWVNDLMIQGKKAGGILSERIFSKGSSYVIVGIGINRETPEEGFPDPIAATATALDVLTDRVPDLASLATRIAGYFLNLWKDPLSPDTLLLYRQALVWKSQAITIHPVIQAPGLDAILLDVDQDYRLLVRLEDGTIKALSSGEVRIRRKP